MVTPTLSNKLLAALGDVKSGAADDPDYAGRDYLGVLKRHGYAERSRDDTGEHWTLTDDGKEVLKPAKKSAKVEEDA